MALIKQLHADNLDSVFTRALESFEVTWFVEGSPPGLFLLPSSSSSSPSSSQVEDLIRACDRDGSNFFLVRGGKRKAATAKGNRCSAVDVWFQLQWGVKHKDLDVIYTRHSSPPPRSFILFLSAPHPHLLFCLNDFEFHQASLVINWMQSDPQSYWGRYELIQKRETVSIHWSRTQNEQHE
ncbi:uncharacterized protein V6R79_021935 [Siganus canaliculatus]